MREVKQKIVEVAVNRSGVLDTAQVLHVSSATVIREKIARRMNKSAAVIDKTNRTGKSQNPSGAKIASAIAESELNEI